MSNQSVSGRPPSGLHYFLHKSRKALKTPMPYLAFIGIGIWLLSYFLLNEYWRVSPFYKVPGPVEVVTEWLNKDPIWGTSLFTQDYYINIWVSCRRIFIAFAIATGLGVPLGLFMGWSKKFKDYTFPILETLRPIPILAWVPLAIVMFAGFETPIIYLATLASFFVTALNTMLGVESIDESYFRAAGCLGSKKHHVFLNVVVPGALPFIFTGLQISIGVAWFSLVAAEMISGDFGLGYMIMDSFMVNKYTTMVMAMLTLGFVGWITSAMVRAAGNRMMQWRERALGQGGV
ncbi:MAG TPA: ABC transporter permease [Gammaproteobacteria bacterium]|jgi:NitT/TauT family transport system permease protein|nr:MAG: ABC transporter permease [Candidatus Endolissoclinum sp. TMED55]RPG01938.1 MAG: ABC transporter permease [Proteobacteria bacterium TMED51]HAU42460.1 ABC transporter permease [Gammaproteobacteria bacterium]HBP85772.1 ABC transporter permease [Gammaproteobacteria bacterium]|tara:strand:+ start:9038 stop:9907 length:870 start_codon:yes stop_codon:yes gene_type:complete